MLKPAKSTSKSTIWDKVAIDYGHRQFARGANERAALDNILADSEKTGMIFITGQDGRPLGSAQPKAHLWDNGTDPAEELNRIIPERASRLVEYHARNPQEPSLADVIDATLQSTTLTPSSPPLATPAKHTVYARIVEWLLPLAANPQASSEAHAIVRNRLVDLKSSLAGDISTQAEAARIDEFLANPEKFIPAKPIEAPPGMPIGDEDF
jgi:hypothetical protein